MKNIPIVIQSYQPTEKFVKYCDKLYKAKFKTVLIVNDGSGKKYKRIYDNIKRKYKFTVIEHHSYLGKGRSLKTAFNYLLNNRKDLLGCITIDQNGQYDPADITNVQKEFKLNPEKIILGKRNFKHKKFCKKLKIFNKLASLAFFVFWGLKIKDTQTSLRAIPVKCMEELLSEKGEGCEFDSQMLISTKDKYKIKQIDITTVYGSKTKKIKNCEFSKVFITIMTNFFKFLTNSVMSFFIDIVLFYAFYDIFRNNNFEHFLLLATILSRLISSCFNYFVNYKLVFKSKQSIKITVAKYYILAIIQMSISAIIVNELAKVLGDSNASIIKLVVDAILFFVNFEVERTLVFEKILKKKAEA